MTVLAVSTPETTRSAGKVTVRAPVDSPIGPVVVEATDTAIVHIELPGSATARIETSPRPRGVMADAVSQLREYFAGKRRAFDLPLEVVGTPFQCAVWEALAEIPYGSVVSYAELAAMVGRPRAFRAVGQANGANPIPIVLPCHRVVASGGSIGGYGGGLAMKRCLLALEGVHLD
jgi:methylated-DNA-[protein]-cysteine S-methyltransferase